MYPVILKVPEEIRYLDNKARTAALGRYARQALERSGKRSGFFPHSLEKNSNGAPLPDSGVHWSISHKPEYVAGVVARSAVGIDIETLRPVGGLLFNRVCTGEEMRCFHGDDQDPLVVFFRTFTAKEAVLKAAGIGLKGLSRTRVVASRGASTTIISLEKDHYTVEHFIQRGYIAAVAGNHATVQWECESSWPGL
ncbi:MAG: 4'-phosphopantetheinyl transferase superfamily protein [Desulfobacteraceae bacterium]